MYKVNAVLLALLLFLGTKTAVCAQENSSEEINQYGFFAGGQAATSGFGLNIRYIFNQRITLKSGIETLHFNKNFDFDENDISYLANFNYKTGGFFLVADYFYARNFYVSAGAAMNALNPRINGAAVSEMQYGDIQIPASKVGDFRFGIEPSYKLSPYGGIGFRKFLGAKKRVTWNLETGLYYIGAPQISIEASGLLAPTADPAHGQKKYLENQIKSYKFYPVLKFNVAVKIF